MTRAQRTLLLACATGWALLACVQILRDYLLLAGRGQPVRMGAVAGSELTLHALWALLTPGVFAVAARHPASRVRSIPVHVAGAAGYCLVHLVAVAAALRLGAVDPRFLGLPSLARPSGLAAAAAADVALYGLTLAAFHAWMVSGGHNGPALRAARLEARLAASQLDMLRKQLQPHFLFNTLHAVSSLMTSDVGAARKMIRDLSDLLRLSLDDAEVQEVSLREELGFLEQYLDIQRARFRDRLGIGYQVADEALNARVPRLILQPLVENALQHGLAPRSAPGHVDVRAWVEHGALRLEVADDGVGIPLDDEPREGHGLGSTRERLRHLYGDGQGMELLRNQTGGVTVLLSIPFIGEIPARTRTVS